MLFFNALVSDNVAQIVHITGHKIGNRKQNNFNLGTKNTNTNKNTFSSTSVAMKQSHWALHMGCVEGLYCFGM